MAQLEYIAGKNTITDKTTEIKFEIILVFSIQITKLGNHKGFSVIDVPPKPYILSLLNLMPLPEMLQLLTLKSVSW
jgi:hypothetical protein